MKTGLCEGKPPVNGGFPSQKPVKRNVFFDVSLNKLLKPTNCRLFQMAWPWLWRYCNALWNPCSLFYSTHITLIWYTFNHFVSMVVFSALDKLSLTRRWWNAPMLLVVTGVKKKPVSVQVSCFSIAKTIKTQVCDIHGTTAINIRCLCNDVVKPHIQ